MESIAQPILVLGLSLLVTLADVDAWSGNARDLQSLGMGHAHMDISCRSAAPVLALLNPPSSAVPYWLFGL
jgi:hypothetical protein